MKNRLESRKIYLDILRVIAIFLVLYTHSGDVGNHFYMSENADRAEHLFSVFMVAFSQCCVPLFFMVSGALLLKKEESLTFVLKHRVGRMLAVLALIVLIQYLLNIFRYPDMSFSIVDYLEILYSKGALTQHWFLYEYISFLLILPFLQRMVKAVSNEKWFLYLFVLYEMIYGICPMFEAVVDWGGFKIVYEFRAAVFYALMGYYIECRSNGFFEKKATVAVAAAGGIFMGIANMLMNEHSWIYGEKLAYISLFVAVYAVAVFIVVRYCCQRCRMTETSRKIWTFAGAGVFGTYLFESQIRELCYPVYLFLRKYIPNYPSVFLWLGCCCIVGIIASNLLKKIPGINKLI